VVKTEKEITQIKEMRKLPANRHCHAQSNFTGILIIRLCNWSLQWAIFTPDVRHYHKMWKSHFTAHAMTLHTCPRESNFPYEWLVDSAWLLI